MRHSKHRYQLNRFSSYRKATIKAITQAMLLHQRVITTQKKAKAARQSIERLITLAKEQSLSARRRAYDLLGNHLLVKRLFDDIAPLFSKRQSGFTRIILWKKRRGDSAQLVIFELTEQKEKTIKKTKEIKKPTEKPIEEEAKELKQPAQEGVEAEKKKKFLSGLRTFFKRKRES